MRATMLPRLICAAVLFALAATAQDDPERERIQRLYDYYERECIKLGWKRKEVKVKGLKRQLLWKGPKKWERGAIIAMHGGSGTYSNFGLGVRIGKPMVDFGKLALKEGFAVFSLDSTDGKVTDSKGRSCGKRWDCMPVEGRENIDLPFIEHVITKVIPDLRPKRGSKKVFITGISNGGYMTILAATHLADRITAFAPVSCGDPYGTYMDMGTHPRSERKNAPGVFRDRETKKLISEKDAAKADAYPNEREWPKVKGKKPPFKLFHHEKDGVVEISCHRKALKQLVKHGFPDAGTYLVKDRGERTILKHFWQEEYNEPLVRFFSK